MANRKFGLINFNVGTTITFDDDDEAFIFSTVKDVKVTDVNPYEVFETFTDLNTGEPLLSSSQIRLLISLESPPGSGKKLFDFNLSEKKASTITLLGEFGQLLYEKGFDVAYNELLQFTTSGKEDFTWETTSLNEEKARVDLINETEVTVVARDDIGVCNKCKSKWITQSQIQNRASDEALKTTYKCAKCKAGKHYLTIY